MKTLLKSLAFASCVVMQGCTVFGLAADSKLCEQQQKLHHDWENGDNQCELLFTYIDLYVDMNIIQNISKGEAPDVSPSSVFAPRVKLDLDGLGASQTDSIYY